MYRSKKVVVVFLTIMFFTSKDEVKIVICFFVCLNAFFTNVCDPTDFRSFDVTDTVTRSCVFKFTTTTLTRHYLLGGYFQYK